MVKIDIEMPTYCYDCPCHNGKSGLCIITGDSVSNKRPFNCPLKEEKVKEEKGGEWRECCRLKIPSCEDRSAIVAILNAAGYKTHIEDNGELYFCKEYYVVVEEKI